MVSGECFSYLWSTGDVTPVVENLCAGVYKVTLTDDYGFQIIDSIELIAPPAIVLDTTVAHVSCFGASDGSIDLSVSGGTAPYSYSWSMVQIHRTSTGFLLGIILLPSLMRMAVRLLTLLL